MKIEKAFLSDGTEIMFEDFNVFIGGNAVGKTTLLLELFQRSRSGNRPRWYWLQDSQLQYSSESPVEDLQSFLTSLSVQYEGANRFYHSRAVRDLAGKTVVNNQYRISVQEKNSADGLVEAYDVEGANQLLRQMKYYLPFISFESCESRLSLQDSVGLTQYDSPPQDSLNVLHRNLSLREEISEMVQSQFGLMLTILSHRGTQLEMGLSRSAAPAFNFNASNLQDEFSRIEEWKNENFISIQDVGHSIRSMARLLMSLQEPTNQIILIDEPELYIYPAQKRWIGRQLVDLSVSQNKQVFLVTHDPLVLQGILDKPGKTRLFRIDMKDDETRSIEQCDLDNLDDVGAKRNQDSYLQALFYLRTIAVEGAADRAFYQVMTEELLGERIADKDLGFVACGGIGASKNVSYLVSAIRLKAAFIYDFDALLFEIPNMIDIASMLGGSVTSLQNLNGLIQTEFEGDSARIKSETNAHKLGIESDYVKNNEGVFKQAINELKAVNIFIVPYGSLESWAPEVEPKYRFSEIAPDQIHENIELSNRLREFLKEVIISLGC